MLMYPYISLGTMDTTKSWDGCLKFGSLPYINMMFRGIHYLKPPCRVGLVVRMSTSHTVGCGFASQPGHTKDHHKNGTNYHPVLHTCIRVGV